MFPASPYRGDAGRSENSVRRHLPGADRFDDQSAVQDAAGFGDARSGRAVDAAVVPVSPQDELPGPRIATHGSLEHRGQPLDRSRVGIGRVVEVADVDDGEARALGLEPEIPDGARVEI